MAASDERIIDDLIYINGLQTEKYNWQFGKIVTDKDETSGRIGIQLKASKFKGKCIRIKKENIFRTDTFSVLVIGKRSTDIDDVRQAYENRKLGRQ